MQHRRFTPISLWLLLASLLIACLLARPTSALADAPDTQGDYPAGQGGPTQRAGSAAPPAGTAADRAARQWRDVQPLPLTAAPGAAAVPDPRLLTPAGGPTRQAGDSGLSWLTRKVNVGNWVVDAVLGGTTAQIHTVNEAVLVGAEGVEQRVGTQATCRAMVFCIAPALFFEGPLGATMRRLWGPFQALAIGLITVFFIVQLNQLQLNGGANRLAALKEIGTLVLASLVVSLAGEWPVTLLLVLFQAINETLIGATAGLSLADLIAFNLESTGLFNVGPSVMALLLTLGWIALMVMVVVRWFRIAVLLLLLPLVGACILLPSTRRYAQFWLDSLIGLLLQHSATVAAFTLGSVMINPGIRPNDGNAASAMVWSMGALLGMGFAFCGTSLFNGLLSGAGMSSSRSAGSWVRSTAGQALSVAAGQRAGMTTATLRGSLASGALLGGLTGGVRGALLGGAASGLTYRRRALTAAETTLDTAFTTHAGQLRSGDTATTERQRRLTPTSKEQLALGDLGREQQRRAQLGQLSRAVVGGTLSADAAQQQAIQLATAEQTARAVQITQLAQADGTLDARTPAEQQAHNRQVQQVTDRLLQRQRVAQRQQATGSSPALDTARAQRRADMLQRWDGNDRAAAAADAAEVMAQGSDPAVLAQMEGRADARATQRAQRITRLDQAYAVAGPATDLRKLDQIVTVTQRQQAVAQRQAVGAQRDDLLRYQRSAEDALGSRRAPAGITEVQQRIVLRYEQRWARADRAAAQAAAAIVVEQGGTPAAVDAARQAADTRGTQRAQRRARLHAALGQGGPAAALARLDAVQRAIRAGEEAR